MREVRLGVATVGLIAALLLVLPVAAHGNDVNVDAQISPDGSVIVETSFIVEDGWLVLHADDGGEPGVVIGYRRFSSDDGFQTDVRVAVNDDVWTRQDGTATRWIALHREGGGTGFDPDDDPILTSFGSLVAEPFELKQGDRALVTAQRFTPQETAEPAVVVRRGVLPVDGYLVVRNGTDGRIVGVRPLAAGDHRNVTVALNESFFEDRKRSRLAVVLYADDGSGSFDGKDEPIRAGSDPIRTTVGFRNTAYESPTPTEGGDGTTTDDPGSGTTTTEGSLSGTASPTVSSSATDASGLGLATGIVAIATVAIAAWRRL